MTYSSLSEESQLVHLLIISLPLCSNQVNMCREYKANIILYGIDIGEAEEYATRKAEDEGLQYVNG